jgi:DNA-binding transcriptional LysR family regulator
MGFARAFRARRLGILSMHGDMSRTIDRHVLDELGILNAVVEAGSFVHAGEALGMTQSAVSRAVARVEQRIGLRIFHRTARSISLTDEGRRFYESIVPHLLAISDAATEAATTMGRVRGRLRVNVDEGIAQFIVTPRLQPFLDEHPDLFVELAIRDRMGDLVREGFDVSVRCGVPEKSSLKSRLLMRTRVVTCASPAYVERHGRLRRPGDVEKHRCILMRDPSTGGQFGWEFVRGRKTVGVHVAGQLMVNGAGPLLAACLAGQGVAQVLELYARDALASGRLVQLLPEWADEVYPMYAFYRPTPVISAKVRAFLDFVIDATRS